MDMDLNALKAKIEGNLGLSLKEEVLTSFREMAEAIKVKIRVLSPTSMADCQYDPSRLTIHIGDDQTVSSVTVG